MAWTAERCREVTRRCGCLMGFSFWGVWRVYHQGVVRFLGANLPPHVCNWTLLRTEGHSLKAQEAPVSALITSSVGNESLSLSGMKSLWRPLRTQTCACVGLLYISCFFERSLCIPNTVTSKCCARRETPVWSEMRLIFSVLLCNVRG